MNEFEELQERFENVLSVNKAINQENKIMDKVITKLKAQLAGVTAERDRLKICLGEPCDGCPIAPVNCKGLAECDKSFGRWQSDKLTRKEREG